MRGLAFALGVAVGITTLPCSAQAAHTWVEHWHNNQGQMMQRTCRIVEGQKRCSKGTRVTPAEPPPSN